MGPDLGIHPLPLSAYVVNGSPLSAFDVAREIEVTKVHKILNRREHLRDVRHVINVTWSGGGATGCMLNKARNLRPSRLEHFV